MVTYQAIKHASERVQSGFGFELGGIPPLPSPPFPI